VLPPQTTLKCVTAYREKKMRAPRRTWKVVGAGTRHSSIEQLQLDLAAFNRCIEVLEKAGADPQDIEVLTAHALMIAERIDEERWLNPAEALGWLFENATRRVTAKVQGPACVSGSAAQQVPEQTLSGSKERPAVVGDLLLAAAADREPAL
jgi:hypothetical protein